MKNKLTETKFKSSLGLTCRFLLSYLAAAMSLLTTAAMGQTWNLRTDWSKTQNPNGVWSYRAGNLVLPAQLDHEPGCWLTPQFAWARSATFSDNDRAPALYRQSTPFLCVPTHKHTKSSAATSPRIPMTRMAESAGSRRSLPGRARSQASSA